MTRPRAAFVYPTPRLPLVEEVRAGREPDTGLLGQNHLAELGIDAWVHDPVLPRARLPSRLTWHLRELTLPWELRRADVVLSTLVNLLPLAARARRRPRVVVLNYGHNVIYRRSAAPRRRLLTGSLRAAALVVCLGESQRRELLELADLPPESVRTVPFGIDERWWSPIASATREPYVLSVGKDPARDYATLARAVDGLDMRVEITTVPRSLRGVRLPPNTRARIVPTTELRDLYAGAAAVVIPQHRASHRYGSEAAGLTALLEGMAMARPLVVTDRPIVRDYVTEDETAIVVPPEDPAALREGLERALANPGSLGEAARLRVEAGLTSRAFAGRLAPILREAAES